MTIKQIAEIAQLTPETVRAKGKELFPDRFAKGVKTVFNQKESMIIMSELRKKGFIQPTENLYQPTENMEVARIDRLESMVEILVKSMASIPAQIIQIANNQPKQIEFKQDYYTIKGYASKNKMQLTFSEALKLGRECGKLSRERCAEIRKADDEQFGQVNSYHIDILKEVFSL